MSNSKIVRLGRAAPQREPPLSTPPELPGLDEVLEAGPELRRDPEDRGFLPAALQMVEAPPRRSAIVVSWAIIAIVAGSIAVSCIAHTTIYAQAPGIVTAVSGTEVIQSQQGGTIAEIRAHDGEHVKKGDALILLDATDALAQRDLVAGKLADARGRSERLKVEIAAVHDGRLDPLPAIAWSDNIPTAIRTRESDVMRGDLTRLLATFAQLDAQRAAKEAARDGYAESIAHERSLMGQSGQRVQMHETLSGMGIESRYKLLTNTLIVQHEEVNLRDLRAKQAEAAAAIVRIEADRVKARATLLDDDQQALAVAERDADTLVFQLQSADKLLSDMTLRAPVSGTVTASAVTTPGQIARSGQQLMQVVPEDSPVQIEAYVLNTDIGYLRPGQPATIKVDTFPYTRYGALRGMVTAVSADAIPGKQALLQQKNQTAAVSTGALSATAAAERVGDLVFPIVVAPKATHILVNGRPAPLLPGMSVVVEVETERQRVIAWVLYPLARGFGL